MNRVKHTVVIERYHPFFGQLWEKKFCECGDIIVFEQRIYEESFFSRFVMVHMYLYIKR